MKLSKEIKDDLRAYLKNRLSHRDVRAQIIAPYMLSEVEVQNIQSKIPLLTGVLTDIVVDKALLAGFMVRVGSKLIDYSLQSKLDSLFTH
jgi:F0F1-type ATP synthase delta subunit